MSLARTGCSNVVRAAKLHCLQQLVEFYLIARDARSLFVGSQYLWLLDAANSRLTSPQGVWTFSLKAI